MRQKVFYKTTKINLYYLSQLIFVARLAKMCKNYTSYGKGTTNQAGGLLSVVQ
jgi:hypothetical protein